MGDAVGRVKGFDRSIALVVGVDRYQNGVPELKSAVADAEALASALEGMHGFEPRLITDGKATLTGLRNSLQQLESEVRPNDRVLFYFAGHGIATDSDKGPMGFLLPVDADRSSTDNYLPMTELHEKLSLLTCRHMLVVLDCCFAGALRWSSYRHLSMIPAALHRERYHWFVTSPAWQVITSAAHDQKAIDIVSFEPLGLRHKGPSHSPFAAALLRGLQGAADRASPGQPGDGVMTATDLFSYIEDQLLPPAGSTMRSQSPLMWPLRKHEKGQFIFLVPGRTAELPQASPLDLTSNPWRGLKSYEPEDAELFFGRGAAVRSLLERISGGSGDSPGRSHLLVVTGPSGSGKSSLVKAGLLPHLPSTMKSIVVEPGRRPFHALAETLRSHFKRPIEGDRLSRDREALSRYLEPLASELVLVVDQAEELVTQSRTPAVQGSFFESLSVALDRLGSNLQIIITVRSEFEPQFSQSALKAHWAAARYLVPAPTQDELRRIIERPAAAKVIRFESHDLVDSLVNDVVQMPGALPLLSFGLSQLYEHFLERRSDDRTITEEDYTALEGGITGALRVAANRVISGVDDKDQAVARGLLERFVSLEGGEFARRRVPKHELEAADPVKRESAEVILKRLDAARLIVSNKAEGEPYVELAHDALILGWDTLTSWLRSDSEDVASLRRLSADSEHFNPSASRRQSLWDDPAQISTIKTLQVSPYVALSRREADFAEASLQRANRNFLVRAAAVAALAIVAAVAVWFAYSTELQRQISESNRLALSSRLTADLDQSMLIAVASARLSEGVQARSALFSALSRRPQLERFLHGATGAVSNIWYLTKDRVLAFTYADAGRVMTWDLSQPSGRGRIPEGLDKDLDEFIIINGFATLVTRRGSTIGIHKLEPATASVSLIAEVEVARVARIFGKSDSQTILAVSKQGQLIELSGATGEELSRQALPGSDFGTVWLEAAGSGMIFQSKEGVWASNNVSKGWVQLRGPPPEGYVFVDLWSGPAHRDAVSILALDQNVDVFPALPVGDAGFRCWVIKTGEISPDCPSSEPIADIANVGFVDGSLILLSTRDVGTGYQRAEYRKRIGNDWSVDSLRVEATFVTGLTMSPDGRSMIVGTIDGEIVEYSLDQFAGGTTRDLSARPLLVHWDEAACTLVLQTDAELNASDCNTPEAPVARLPLNQQWKDGPERSRDGKVMYALDAAGMLVIWDHRLNELAKVAPPQSLEFSVLMDVLFDDERDRLSVVIDESPDIWSFSVAARTWTKLATAPFKIRAFAADSAGTIYIGALNGGGIVAIDPDTGNEVFRNAIPNATLVGTITPTGFSGRLLVTALAIEHRLFLVDARTGTLQSDNLNRFSGPAHITAASDNAGHFVVEGVGTQDERPIESGAFGGLSVEIWDFGALLPLGEGMRTRDYDREAMSFSPSGDRLAVAFTSPPRLVTLPLAIEQWIKSACARAGRDMTPHDRARFGVPEDLQVCPDALSAQKEEHRSPDYSLTTP